MSKNEGKKTHLGPNDASGIVWARFGCRRPRPSPACLVPLRQIKPNLKSLINTKKKKTYLLGSKTTPDDNPGSLNLDKNHIFELFRITNLWEINKNFGQTCASEDPYNLSWKSRVTCWSFGLESLDFPSYSSSFTFHQAFNWARNTPLAFAIPSGLSTIAWRTSLHFWRF